MSMQGLSYAEQFAPHRSLIKRCRTNGMYITKIAEQLIELGVRSPTFDESPWQFDERLRVATSLGTWLRRQGFKSRDIERNRCDIERKQRQTDFIGRFNRLWKSHASRGRVIDMGGIRDREMHWTPEQQWREFDLLSFTVAKQ